MPVISRTHERVRINRTTDPLLKKRVIFVAEPHPLRKWAMGGGIVFICLCLIGATVYFYPEIIHLLNRFNSPSSSQPIILTPQKPTPPIAIETPPAENPVEKNSVAQTTNITNTTQHETLTSLASSPTSEKSSPVVEQKSAPLKTSSSNTISKIENSPMPIEKPTPQLNVKPLANDTSQMAATNQGNLKQIKQLLKKSAIQIRRTRFTSPKGDNAYETYQALLKIAPQEAEILLDKIVAWYYERGRKYIEENKLTQPESGNAWQMYQKIDEIAPQHPNTQALFTDMIATLNQQATQYLDNNNWVNNNGESAYTIYQQLNVIAPQADKTQQLLNTIIDGLLEQAQQQMAQQKYTTPDNDNAADTYKKILEIAPTHIKAAEGLEEIVQKYYRLALLRKNQKRYKGSMIWINRGLQVNPAHQKLNELKQEIREKLSR
jgi:tetratricopeptide (TPR) repeat protein